MEIRINTLLKICAVFLLFGNLNAMYRIPDSHHGGSSTDQGSGSNPGGIGPDKGSYSNIEHYAMDPESFPNFPEHAMNQGSIHNFGDNGMHQGSYTNMRGYEMNPGSYPHMGGYAMNPGSVPNSAEHAMNQRSGPNSGGHGIHQTSYSNVGGYAMNPGSYSNIEGYAMNPESVPNFAEHALYQGSGSTSTGHGMHQTSYSNVGGHAMDPGPYSNIGGYAMNLGSVPNFSEHAINQGSVPHSSGHGLHQTSHSDIGGYAMNPGSVPNFGGHRMDQGLGTSFAGHSMNSGTDPNGEENHIIYVRNKRVDLKKRMSLEGTALYFGYKAQALLGDELGSVIRYGSPVDAVVYYGLVRIELWLCEDKRTVFHAYFPGCYIPHMSYYRKNNFLVRWVRLKDEHGTPYDLVAFVGYQGRLIGVRTAALPKGQKKIQIKPEIWLLLHNSRRFEVFVNAKERRLTGIQLEKGNKERHAMANTMIVDVANIQFMVYSNPDNSGNPSGAELVGNNVITIGEKFDPPVMLEPEKVKHIRPSKASSDAVEGEVIKGRNKVGKPRKTPPDGGEEFVVKEKKRSGRPRKYPINEGGSA